MLAKFTTAEDLNRYIAAGNECPEVARDCFGNTWVLDKTEEGDWQGVRPRRDDDQEEGPGEDVWRPIGPTPVQHMPFPPRHRDRRMGHRRILRRVHLHLLDDDPATACSLSGEWHTHPAEPDAPGAFDPARSTLQHRATTNSPLAV